MPDTDPSDQPFDIFLSHHSADKDWVRRLRDGLWRKVPRVSQPTTAAAAVPGRSNRW